jgi:hypothetical protein
MRRLPWFLFGLVTGVVAAQDVIRVAANVYWFVMAQYMVKGVGGGDLAIWAMLAVLGVGSLSMLAWGLVDAVQFLRKLGRR